MGTRVDLVGIRNVLVGTFVAPGMVAWANHVGYGNLVQDLAIFCATDPGILSSSKENCNEVGFDQYFVIDPLSFLEHIKEDEGYWDTTGEGWKPALAMIEKNLEEPDLITWWFVIDY